MIGRPRAKRGGTARSAPAEAGPFDGLGFTFVIRSGDQRLVDFFTRAYANLAVADPEGDPHLYDARADGVWLDSSKQCGCTSLGTQVRQILWQVNRKAIDASRNELLLLHAAAVSLHGRAIVLPADSGSGKSTLAATLVHAGLDYVTDEIVAIEPGTLAIRPFPKPVSLDPGSFELLRELQSEAVTISDDPQWQVVPDVVASKPQPALVALPSHAPDASSRLEALGPADAVIALAENSFNFLDDGSRWLPTLGALVEAAPCHRLPVGDLDAASRVLLDAL